ncbi:laminin subunit alpha-3-like [Octopus bimaculoides]|uniref:laminin subunit alpha-3-like n=1 Tax=Octopus bimaculoides TaxID=37653 RepID=UPI0022E204F3|nr:laminin subunit alpha-3-like [Octopus bimaculoides]
MKYIYLYVHLCVLSTACDCNVGGSATMNCNKQTGQCICKPRVFGMKCDKPLKTYFFPTLHQQKYEIEDGYRPGGGKVYFAFDQRVFPDFSWKGYAIMSEKQVRSWYFGVLGEGVV